MRSNEESLMSTPAAMAFTLVLTLAAPCLTALEAVVPEIPRQVEALGSTTQSVRSQAIKDLKAAGSAAVPELIVALCHPAPLVKAGAAMVLKSMKQEGRSAVPALTLMLADPSPEARSAAADALAWTASDLSLCREALFTALEKDEAPSVRGLAAVALGRLGRGDKEAVAALIQSVTAQRNRQAIWALGALGTGELTAEVLPALTAFLTHEDPAMQIEAIRALQTMKEKASPAIPDLCKRITPGGGEVSEAAVRAIRLIDPAAAEKLKSDGVFDMESTDNAASRLLTNPIPLLKKR